jgi:hypothetical protein
VKDGAGRKFDGEPKAFRIAEDDTGPFFYANEPAPVYLEYTVRPVCGARAAGDQLFVSAFAWRLASELAMPLTRVKGTMELCLTMFKTECALAEERASSQQQQEPPGDGSEWTRAM